MSAPSAAPSSSTPSTGPRPRPALASRPSLPRVRVGRRRHLHPGGRRPLRRGARPRHRGAAQRPHPPRSREHGGRGRALRHRPGRRPHRPVGLLEPSLSRSTARRRRRRPARAAFAARRSIGAAPRASFAAATRSRAVARAPRPAPRSQRCGRRSPPRPRGPGRAGRAVASAGSRSRARISGSVTVPSSRSVPRALPVRSGGPVTSRTSSSSWKARPISRPKVAQRLVGARILRARSGRRTRTGARSSAGSAQVALGWDPRSNASRRWASSPCARPTDARASRATWRSRAVGRELGERTGEQQVADGRGRVAPRRRATTVGAPAPQRRGVEDVVVDERRHVDELDGGRGADRPLARRLGPRRAAPASAAAACRRPSSVASASAPRRRPWSATARRAAARPRPSARGSQASAASRTSVTGGGTERTASSTRSGCAPGGSR